VAGLLIEVRARRRRAERQPLMVDLDGEAVRAEQLGQRRGIVPGKRRRLGRAAERFTDRVARGTR
jgi:hypothetical protein